MAISLNDKYKPEERYRAVVKHGRGMLIVSAGPGTGKTFSLLRKIESLLDMHIEPDRIYYLTFVNSIVDAFKADAKKDKVNGGLGEDPDELGIHISTLHSLAFKIVKSYSDHLELAPHLEVLDLSRKPPSVLSQIFVKDLLECAKRRRIVADKNQFDKLVSKLTEVWRRNLARVNGISDLEKVADLLCERYQVCPWDKLVLLAIQAVKEFGLPEWIQRAQHFLIDEYQDFNPAEQHLIELITEPSDSVVIVGDPDQSIYRGRSASPQGLIDLLAKNDVKSVNFVYCRRCSRNVLDAANRLLQYMDKKGFQAKELQPYKSDEGAFIIKQFKSCKAEAEAIAKTVKKLVDNDVKDIIILFPSNRARQFYFQKLSELGIHGSIKTVDTEEEVKAALLRLALQRDHPFLERVAITLFRNLEGKYVDDVLDHFLENSISVGDALVKASSEKQWKAKAVKVLTAYKQAIRELTSGHRDSIASALANLSVNIDMQTVDALLNTDDSQSARERVEQVLHPPKSGSDESSEVVSSVRFLTMHSAKGLSKQIVVIPAFEDKWLPGPRDSEELAEMNRLVFVAITRAESQVWITFPKTRAKGDPLNYPVKGISEGISRYAQIMQPSK